MIKRGDKVIISDIVITSILGVFGDGIWQLKIISPAYRKLLKMIIEYGVTIFAKSATFHKKIGNVTNWNLLSCLWYIQKYMGGLINAYGLTNPDAEKCAKGIGQAQKKGFRIIPNYYPEFANGLDQAFGELMIAIGFYNHYLSNFEATELNLSCNHSGVDVSDKAIMDMQVKLITKLKKEHPNLIIIGKGSAYQPLEFYRKLVEVAGIDVIHAINSVRLDQLHPGAESPLHRGTMGSLSGGPILSKSLEFNNQLRRVLPNTPIIMGGGITNIDDLEFFNLMDPCAISVCTAARLQPENVMKIIKGDVKLTNINL